jgi:hypothetical protein
MALAQFVWSFVRSLPAIEVEHGHSYTFNQVFIHSSVAAQPFVGPWPPFQFRNTGVMTPWTGDQSIAREQHKLRINVHIHIASEIFKFVTTSSGQFCFPIFTKYFKLLRYEGLCVCVIYHGL